MIKDGGQVYDKILKPYFRLQILSKFFLTILYNFGKKKKSTRIKYYNKNQTNSISNILKFLIII